MPLIFMLKVCVTARAYSIQFYTFLRFFDHRASAAFRAAVFRCAGDILAANAGPPFNPPSRPSATAAGFFGFIVMRSECQHPKVD